MIERAETCNEHDVIDINIMTSNLTNTQKEGKIKQIRYKLKNLRKMNIFNFVNHFTISVQHINNKIMIIK